MTEELACSTMYYGGIDMFMMPMSKAATERHIKNVKRALTRNELFNDRLVDAAAKIIAVKMAMGLVESVKSPEDTEAQPNHQQPEKSLEELHGSNEYLDSLQAVRESLVLLKNDNNVLPVRTLSTTLQYVVLVGEKIININRLTKLQLFRNFDNIGMQAGGWSVRWQGFMGNDFWTGANKQQSNASSILDALTLLKKRNNFTLVYPNYSTFTDEVRIDTERNTFLNDLKNLRKNMTSRNTLMIGVVGEPPYAETAGDRNIPYCQNVTENATNTGCLYDSGQNPYISATQDKNLNADYANFDTEVINSVRTADAKIPLVTVLLSGRPMIVDSAMNVSSAFIAAWLPGTSGGQGIVDAICGDYLIRPNGKVDKANSLSVDWPANMVRSMLLRIRSRTSLSTIPTVLSLACRTRCSKWAMACPQERAPTTKK